MTTRPTTLVESDQLAQAAAIILRNDDFIAKSKRWPFARISKAHKDYEKAVQEITARRRKARETAVEGKTKKAKVEADSVFERAKAVAQAAHDEKIAEAKKPYDEVEAKARSERDAAIAAANLAYQHTVDKAKLIYQQDEAAIEQKRDAAIGDAKAAHDEAYAAVEAERKAGMMQIAKDLKTIALEGPMRIVEDREAWSPEERRKALIGIVDMVGEESLAAEDAELSLQNIAGYVFQDRYLKPDAQHHRLMDANLIEALVDLAVRSPTRRPSVVKYMYEIVEQNPGHSSPAFIKNLTQLYVATSSDTLTTYAQDPSENETIFEAMRAHISDTLKLTPRRSLIPAPAANGVVARDTKVSKPADDLEPPTLTRPPPEDITADVHISELLPVEPEDAPPVEAQAGDQASAKPAPASTAPKPPPPLRGGGRVRRPEGST